MRFSAIRDRLLDKARRIAGGLDRLAMTREAASIGVSPRPLRENAEGEDREKASREWTLFSDLADRDAA